MSKTLFLYKLQQLCEDIKHEPIQQIFGGKSYQAEDKIQHLLNSNFNSE